MSEKDIYSGTIAGVYVVAAKASNGMVFVDFYNEKPANIEEVESDACLEMVPEQTKEFLYWLCAVEEGSEPDAMPFLQEGDMESLRVLNTLLPIVGSRQEEDLLEMTRLAEALEKGGS